MRLGERHKRLLPARGCPSLIHGLHATAAVRPCQPNLSFVGACQLTSPHRKRIPRREAGEQQRGRGHDAEAPEPILCDWRANESQNFRAGGDAVGQVINRHDDAEQAKLGEQQIGKTAGGLPVPSG